MLGPGSMPPQAQRSFVRELLRRGRGSVSVSAALVEETPGVLELELMNDGGETAVGLRYVVADAEGKLSGGSVGNLPPGTSVKAKLSDAGACVWSCRDAKGRVHVWSYDGRHKRLKTAPSTNEELFRVFVT